MSVISSNVIHQVHNQKGKNTTAYSLPKADVLWKYQSCANPNVFDLGLFLFSVHKQQNSYLFCSLITPLIWLDIKSRKCVLMLLTHAKCRQNKSLSILMMCFASKCRTYTEPWHRIQKIMSVDKKDFPYPMWMCLVIHKHEVEISKSH